MRCLVLVLLVVVLPAISRAEELRVAAAISLKDVLTSVIVEYQKENRETAVTPTYASSGALAAQIKAGGGIDLFISAAEAQVADLTAAKLTVPETRIVVARNTLVLVTPLSNPENLKKLEDLKNLKGKLALGHPALVPAGMYASQLLKHLGLEELLKPNLVFGANVRQVLAYVERGEVAGGFVYGTDAREAGEKVKVIAVAPESSHDPIIYPAIVIAGSKHQPEAGKFLAFLSSDKAKALLKEKGFALP